MWNIIAGVVVIVGGLLALEFLIDWLEVKYIRGGRRKTNHSITEWTQSHYSPQRERSKK